MLTQNPDRNDGMDGQRCAAIQGFGSRSEITRFAGAARMMLGPLRPAQIEPAGYRLGNQKGAYRAPLGDVAGGGILAALLIPLGSLIELLVPPTLATPAGMPLTPVVPAPAEPAFGVPTAFPDAAPAAGGTASARAL